MQALTQKKTVVAVFVTEARMERDCIRLYARTHPEVRAAAVLSGGQELLQHLRCGLTPQVLVLDVLLTDMGILTLMEEIHGLHLDPEPTILLTVPVPEQTAARRAMQIFGDCQILLKPYRLKELFDQVYLLGAGADQYRLYRARGFCRRCLQQMRADPAMSGCDYLEQMVLYAFTAERALSGRSALSDGGPGLRHPGGQCGGGRHAAFPQDVAAGDAAVPAAVPAVRTAEKLSCPTASC